MNSSGRDVIERARARLGCSTTRRRHGGAAAVKGSIGAIASLPRVVSIPVLTCRAQAILQDNRVTSERECIPVFLRNVHPLDRWIPIPPDQSPLMWPRMEAGIIGDPCDAAVDRESDREILRLCDC